MNRPQMLLSIIIPVFNEESTIGDIIDRTNVTLRQIGLPSEIIVVDNQPSMTNRLK